MRNVREESTVKFMDAWFKHTGLILKYCGKNCSVNTLIGNIRIRQFHICWSSTNN